MPFIPRTIILARKAPNCRNCLGNRWTMIFLLTSVRPSADVMSIPFRDNKSFSSLPNSFYNLVRRALFSTLECSSRSSHADHVADVRFDLIRVREILTKTWKERGILEVRNCEGCNALFPRNCPRGAEASSSFSFNRPCRELIVQCFHRIEGNAARA